MPAVTQAATGIPVLRIDALDLRFVPKPWAFAEERREKIAAYFKRLERPGVWNGRTLLMHRHEIAGTMLRGSFFETDYASFLAWRDWGFPDPAVKNCFGLAAVCTSDNAFLTGVMGAHTANAGRVYFPGGTLDPTDLVGGRVDLEASMRRELTEETGLRPDDFDIEPGWHATPAGPRLGLIKVLRSRETAAILRECVLAHLAQEETPELSDIRFVSDPGDLDPQMPPFVIAFLAHFWQRSQD